MKQKVNTYKKLFLFFSMLGFLLVFIELILNFFGTKLCETEGCELVAKQVRFGDWIILLLGLVIFSSILITFKVYLSEEKKGDLNKGSFYNTICSYILIIALACEGFFTGYQAFRLFTPCYFCLIIFTIIVILGFIKLLMGSWELVSGFGALAGVFILFYLVLPVNNVVKVPEDNLTIFYSENCKHCKELLKELEEKKIQIPHVLIDENPDFLKSVGIDKVPVLFINLPGEKKFLIGLSNIRSYLFPEPEKKVEKRAVRKETGAKKKDEQKSILDLVPTSPFIKPPDDACDETKEDCN